MTIGEKINQYNKYANLEPSQDEIKDALAQIEELAPEQVALLVRMASDVAHQSMFKDARAIVMFDVVKSEEDGQQLQYVLRDISGVDATNHVIETLIALSHHGYELVRHVKPFSKRVDDGNGGNGGQTEAPVGYRDFDAEQIILTYADDGREKYKIKGYPFNKFGVDVFPEVLPRLGIDPQSLNPGPNNFTARVRCKLKEETGSPDKVIGLAE